MSEARSLQGIIVHLSPRAERYTHWEVFARTEGFVAVTVPEKMGLPFGLFDRIEIIGTAKGKSLFAKEIYLIERPTALARNMAAFQEASNLARLMTAAFHQMPDYAPIFDIFRKALEYYTTNKGTPQLISFKALYKILQAEGFPVKEDWLEKLPKDLQTKAIEALKIEVAHTKDFNFEPKIIESLQRWAREELSVFNA